MKETLASRIENRLEGRDCMEDAERIAKSYHVTVEMMLAKNRHKSAASARHELWRYFTTTA